MDQQGMKDAFWTIYNLRCEMAGWGFEFLILKFTF